MYTNTESILSKLTKNENWSTASVFEREQRYVWFQYSLVNVLSHIPGQFYVIRKEKIF